MEAVHGRPEERGTGCETGPSAPGPAGTEPPRDPPDSSERLQAARWDTGQAGPAPECSYGGRRADWGDPREWGEVWGSEDGSKGSFEINVSYLSRG